jgi:hypothetical protein
MLKLSLHNAQNFIEWFVGFSDAESCFYIRKSSKIANQYEFIFRITLHIDDSKVLNYVLETLGIGKIYYSVDKVIFEINKHSEIQILLNIFKSFPLNSVKYLNYLDFKSAFELYISSPKSLENTKIIDNLKNNMNAKRTDFSMPDTHTINITPNWLLGFIEGEGSFFVEKKELRIIFSITQKSNTTLMAAIQKFLNELDVNKKYIDIVKVSYDKRISNKGEITNLYIYSVDYIINILIPFLNKLNWHSKKELDYKDWITVLKLKNLGLNYTGEGVRVITLILNQMNSYRLSTNSEKLDEDQLKLLQIDIEKLLNGPSNLEVKEDGRVFIKSLNRYASGGVKIKVELYDKDGLIFKSFDSITTCANFLGLSITTVRNKIQKDQTVLIDNQEFKIKKKIV